MILKWKDDPIWNLNSVLNNTFSRDDYDRTNAALRGTTLPAVNISETNDLFTVTVAAPGMDKEDFSINLENSLLTICADRQDKAEEDEVNFTRREFNYKKFQRSFTLPLLIEADKITAKYEKGLLIINIPKKEEAKQKPLRTINIA